MEETNAVTNASALPPEPDWDQAVQSDEASKSDRESLFWRLSKRPEPYKFRIVDKPVMFRQHWRAFRNLRREDGKSIGPVISPAYYEKDKNLDAAWNQGGYQPDRKYGCLVIDRDSGNLRVLTTGPGVFKMINDYQKETGSQIYGDGGPDWSVRVKVTRAANGREKTEYAVVPLPAKPLTEDEKAKIKAFTDKVKWQGYFTRQTPAYIQSLYDRLAPEDKVAPKVSTSGNQAPETAGVASVAPEASDPVVATATATVASATTTVPTTQASSASVVTTGAAPVAMPADDSWIMQDNKGSQGAPKDPPAPF